MEENEEYSVDDIKEIQETLLGNVKTLENFITLSLGRENLQELSQYNQLVELIHEVEALLIECERQTRDEVPDLLRECDEVMRQMRAKEALILKYIHEKRLADIENKKKSCEDKENQQQPPQCSKTVGTVPKPIQNNKSPNVLSMKQYAESPMIKKKAKPSTKLHFIEFERELSDALFEKVPKYLRGRTPFSELNDFYKHTIVECFNDKYKLMLRPRIACLDLEKWQKYHTQASLLPGRHFITEEDIMLKLDIKVVNNKTRNFLNMLRQMSVLNVERVSHNVCYIWASGSQNFR